MAKMSDVEGRRHTFVPSPDNPANTYLRDEWRAPTPTICLEGYNHAGRQERTDPG